MPVPRRVQAERRQHWADRRPPRLIVAGCPAGGHPVSTPVRTRVGRAPHGSPYVASSGLPVPSSCRSPLTAACDVGDRSCGPRPCPPRPPGPRSQPSTPQPPTLRPRRSTPRPAPGSHKAQQSGERHEGEDGDREAGQNLLPTGAVPDEHERGGVDDCRHRLLEQRREQPAAHPLQRGATSSCRPMPSVARLSDSMTRRSPSA